MLTEHVSRTRSFQSIKQEANLHVFQEWCPLCKQLVAIWTFKHVHLLCHQMSVEMDGEQRFLGKNGPAHHAFIYLPVGKNHKRALPLDQKHSEISNTDTASQGQTHLDCLAFSESWGCWVPQWVSALEADLKAMGQEGHLWKTSEWAVCMWFFTALRLFTPPNTSWQQGHLDKETWEGGKNSYEWGEETKCECFHCA